MHSGTYSGIEGDRDPAAAITAGCNQASWRSLLERLETSMQMSQRALLSRDVDTLERLTGEQLSGLLQLREWVNRDGVKGDSGGRQPGWSQAAKRVLEVGRVLEFLVRRMQQRLIVAVNCSSEAQATYQPPAVAPLAVVPVRRPAGRS